jgi:rare lipoprotein A
MRAAFLVSMVLMAASACAAHRPDPMGLQQGTASWISDSLAGRSTASGAPYDPTAHTCAHKTLPFGTRVEITVAATGRKSTCVINDRGPFKKGRIIDVSRAVAEDLGLVQAGLLEVDVRPLR